MLESVVSDAVVAFRALYGVRGGEPRRCQRVGEATGSNIGRQIAGGRGSLRNRPRP